MVQRDGVPKVLTDQRASGSLSSPQDGPRLSIIGIKTFGAGCPEGTVASQIAGDGQAFTLLFSSFQVTYAPAENLYQRSTRCAVAVRTLASPGWQFSLVSLDLRGWADIGPQNRAEIHTKISFKSETSSKKFVAKLAGPYADNFQFRATFPAERDLAPASSRHRWSACKPAQDLRIETSLVLKPARGEDGQTPMTLTVDSKDGSFHHQWGLRWRPCRT